MAGVHCLSLGFLVFMVGVLSISNIDGVNSQNCDDVIIGLRKECSAYVMKLQPNAKPSQPCCDFIKKADVKCVCENMTTAVQVLIDVNKVVDVTKTCGKPIPSGTKCGSNTIP